MKRKLKSVVTFINFTVIFDQFNVSLLKMFQFLKTKKDRKKSLTSFLCKLDNLWENNNTKL